MVQFQTLSHAGLRVNAGGKELMCDPWLIGSCYWRSWWNYPPVPEGLVKSLKPDFIYLTHLHWDHFQGPSLKIFPPDTPVIVPYDRYDRMIRDLRSIGFNNIIELKHGERLELAPGFALRSYHFSPFITDSAIVVEAEGQVILNANDAKLAGMPLKHVLRDYPSVDFCFRSHSSANNRACIHIIGEPDVSVDDNEHYLRAFSLFVERVRPRYAIPFASNNCLLHDDVFHLNRFIQTPDLAKSYFESFSASRGLNTQLQIMLPGDTWSSETGFSLTSEDWFSNREQRLLTYQERIRPTLERQAALEAKVKVPLNLVRGFFEKLAADTPRWFLGALKGREVLLVAKSEREIAGFAVSLEKGTTRAVKEVEFGDFDVRVEFPALILFQAIKMNMFGHAAISKRVHYYATREALPALGRLTMLLDLAECELLPIRRNFTWRTVRALLPRWREGVLYASVLLDLKRGLDFPAIEERQLQLT